MPPSVNQQFGYDEMLSPPPPSHHRNFRAQPPIYSSPCYAKSAPNLLRSRGESVPLSQSHQPYLTQMNGNGSVGFPGNIPGEYGSDDDHRQYDQYDTHGRARHYQSDSIMQESPEHTHIVTPYAYPRPHPGPNRLDIPYNPPHPNHYPARSRNTSHSTYLSTPTTATTNLSSTTPISTHTPMRSRTTTQASTILSPASSSRLQALPFGSPSDRGVDTSQAGRHNDHYLLPGAHTSRNRFRGRPGTGSTVDSIPYSLESSVSAHHHTGTNVIGYHNPSPTVLAKMGQEPVGDQISTFSSPNAARGHLHDQRTYPVDSVSKPPTKSTIPRRLQPLYTFLTAPRLTVDMGIEGVQEWVGYWVNRGVRLRDLSSDLSGLIKGPLALHPNLPIVQRILQDPKTHLILPPQLHKCSPLLSSQDFRDISKKIIVDALISADRLYSGVQATGIEDANALEPKPEPPRRRFRSNSGSDLQARERKIEEDREAREGDRARREGGGSTTPSLSFSNSGSASNGLARFLSRSGKKDKVSIDHNRPVSITQDNGSEVAGPSRTLFSAPEDLPRLSKKFGFFKRRQKSSASGRQDTTTLDDPVGVGGMSARGLTAIFLGSGKVKSKKDPTQSSISNIERMQIRSLDRTVRGRDYSTGDFDLNMDLVGGDRNVSRRQAEVPTTLKTAPSQPSSKLREQQVQEVLLAFIKRMTAWDLKKEIHSHSSEDNDSLTASGSDSRDGPPRSASRMGAPSQESRIEATSLAERNSKKGMMELEALNAKLAQIEFEMILNCGRHFHPAIQSALHKVRFHMGYCSSIQLVKRLNALDREFHRNADGQEIQTELSLPEKQRVMIKLEAWLRVRWDIVDRWDLTRIVKDEILEKIPEDFVPLVHGAMQAVLLPTTPFPPFRSSASNFRVAKMLRNSTWNQRRPSLPNTLATWGGSTPNLISGSVKPIDTFNDAGGLLLDIIALPTAPNTKELLIEWLRHARQYHLMKSCGWWISVDGGNAGIHHANNVLQNLEMGCLDHGQHHLNPVFVEIRKAFQLPQQSDHIVARTDKIRQEMIEYEASQYRSSVTPKQVQRPKIVHHSSYEPLLEEERTAAPSSGTALQLITEVPPPASAQHNLKIEEHTWPASDETESGAVRHNSSDESHRSSGALASDTGHDSDQILATRAGVLGSDKVDTGSPRLSLEMPRHVAARHRKGLSMMSVFSSETALEMASIFATRGSESRASVRRNSSPEPEPEPEPPLPKLSPLTEEPRSISEFGGPDESEPIVVPATPSKSKSVPLTEELELPVGSEDELEDGTISPFPKPTSPPHSIPNRSTSLHHGRPDRSATWSNAPVTNSIFKPTVQAQIAPDRSVSSLPSTLSQVMRLFEPGLTQLATSLTPGMLEIELLKIIESERQKASCAGREWNHDDVSRVMWLLKEIQTTAAVSHIDHIFARVRSSLESHSVTSSTSSDPSTLNATSRVANSVDDRGIAPRPGQIPLPSHTVPPLSRSWSEFPDEKAASSAGQLRLVNPPVDTPWTAEEDPAGKDLSRPQFRSAVSAYEGLPASEISRVIPSDADVLSTRQSRRVSFAGYDSSTQVRHSVSQESFVNPIHEVLQLPSLEGPSAVASGIWSHEIKDAPPPYHHSHKRARSETP